jgi:hypothetical protein
MAEGFYLFETYEAGSGDWDRHFTDWLNGKFNSGYKYESCFYNWEGDKRRAHCVFKRR